MKNLPADEFNSMVQTLIKQKKSADVTLYEEASRNWNEILSAEYVFDRFAREIQILEGIQSKEDMIDALAEYRYGIFKECVDMIACRSS